MPAARDFMAKYFGLVTVMEVGKNFLVMQQDNAGMVLNLSHFDKSSTAEVDYHKDFHVGFFVEGRYGFYVTAPGGFVVEVSYLT